MSNFLSPPASRKGRPPIRVCPECGSPDEALVFHLARDQSGSVAICRACAAICRADGLAQKPRPLKTQEWLDLTLEPCWYDVLEARAAILDALTAPALPEGGHPR